MARKTTKTSSFGTSKREGHDASQFYSSNLYQGLVPADKCEIFDNSATIPESWFTHSCDFSLVHLNELPELSLHLAIWDLNGMENELKQYLEENPNKFLQYLTEFHRILITGGIQ